MSEEENMNQNEEEMDEEILINQEEGEGQDMYAFEIEINGEPYIIIIGKTDENKIFLRLMDKEDQAKPFFQNEFSLDDLRILNPIFNNIDSEDLAFQYLASNLNDAEKDLKIIDEEKINFNMIITDEDEKIELDFVLYKTIDEGNGENEIMENPENMENEMEEGEDNMIHEVNEDNGEMVESNKDDNIPSNMEEKKGERVINRKQNIAPNEANANVNEAKNPKKEDMEEKELIMSNIISQDIPSMGPNQNSMKEKELIMSNIQKTQGDSGMEPNQNSMKDELLNIINSLNENFNNQIMKQNEALNSMKEDLLKQSDNKINQMKEELNKKDKEISELKNTIGNLQQKLNEYEAKLDNINNTNNKSLRNSNKSDNSGINNKMVNELKSNIAEIKNLYEKDKKEKENNIKKLSDEIKGLENKLPKNKGKDVDPNKLLSLEKDLKALSNKINEYEFDQLIENIAILMEKQDDNKIYEIVNNLGEQVKEMNQKINKKEKDSIDSKRGNKSDPELMTKMNNFENNLSKLQTKLNKFQEERDKEKLNDSNNKYKLSDIIKLTNDLKNLNTKTDSLHNITKKLENENKELNAKTNNLMDSISQITQMPPKQGQVPYTKIQAKKVSNQKPTYYNTLENQGPAQGNQVSYYNRTNPNLSNCNPTQDSINSKIVNYEDIIFLQNRIKQIHPKIKDVFFNLVYCASEDGDKAADFHRKCDTIGPNVAIIKTRKGNIFGGFTFKNWEHLPRDVDVKRPNLGSASRDSNAFGFSVNSQKIYNNEKPNEFAIWCNRNFGPTFKNNLFQIFDSCMRKGGYCSIRANSHFGGQNYDYEISGGESRFKVEELEVFEIKLQ